MKENFKGTVSYIEDGTRISLHHQQLLGGLNRDLQEQENLLTESIDSSTALLSALGYDVLIMPSQPCSQSSVVIAQEAKTWEVILAEAKNSTPHEVDFNMLLSQNEIDAILAKHRSIGSELDWMSSLDRFDYTIAIASGLVAGLLDVLLVGIPAHPGFLGGPSSEGGWLSNLMKEKTGRLFPEEKIKELEQAYKVSYDPSTSSRLGEKVAGLGPRTHRFQSVGHDPLLGFIFGVRDILSGEFTAISKDGQLVIQQVADPLLQGEQLFVRIAEAMKTQFGHLSSDIATRAGLPAPLMPLIAFFQVGSIGKQAYTIGEVARQMYRSGYDFRHFMATSVPVMVAEIMVRLGFFVRSLNDGKPLAEAVPSNSSIKLRRLLLIAHTVAMTVNAGKVYVTQNPLAISWAQVLAFLRYVLPELAYLLHGQEVSRIKMIEDNILKDYRQINLEIDLLTKIEV